jgi:hypothetical protein
MVSSSRDDLVVVVAEGMTAKLTYDGVDVCASRVAWEVGQQNHAETDPRWTSTSPRSSAAGAAWRASAS